MNIPALAQIPSVQVDVKKKRVLLLDASHAKRDLRAQAMRNLGMDVDCAADIGEARSWWRADLYDLVLINIDNGPGHRDSFCADIRKATPPQRMAFLVGKPEYLATKPNADDLWLLRNGNCPEVAGDVTSAVSDDLGRLTQRWGILEASRQISAVRSACAARAKATRDRPAPARDSEGTRSKRTLRAATLDDLLREELR